MKKPEPKEYIIQPKGWKKKYKCHKNKADHTFVIQYAHKCDWRDDRINILEYFECNACGKKSMEIAVW